MKREISLSVGQIIYVRRRYNGSYIGEITKVGRKYAAIGGGYYRVNMEDRTVVNRDGDDCGKAYLSVEEHTKLHERATTWEALRKLVRDATLAPEHMTTHDIQRMINMLNPQQLV